ncbi:RidA family protein [Klebsiella pneumoniae]|nr:RidA family protein [Klebsiella pneumoniae]
MVPVPAGSTSFARAVEAGGWLYVSGQTPMKMAKSWKADCRPVASGDSELRRYHDRSGLHLADVVHVKVILTDARYFQSFNKVFREFFGDNPPARICCVADLVVDCKVEVDVTCFNAARQ